MPPTDFQSFVSSSQLLTNLSAGPSTERDFAPMFDVANEPLHLSKSRVERWLDGQFGLDIASDEASQISSSIGIPRSPIPPMNPPQAVSDSTVFRDDQRCANMNLLESSKPDSESTAPVLVPSTPRKNFSFRQTPIFHTPSPLRNIHRAIHARRSSASSNALRSLSSESVNNEPQLSLGSSTNHSKSSSLSTLYPLTPTSRDPLPTSSPILMGTPTWKAQRPSIMDFFSPSSSSSEDPNDMSPARPSSASTISHSTVATPRASSEAPSVSHRLGVGSVRSHSSTGFFSTSPSLWSLPADATHINDAPDSEKVIAQDRTKTNTLRIPLPLKSQTNTATFGPVSIMLTSPKARKKRKLVISGIAAEDDRRVEAVKKWCETFGEVNSITRVRSGDLHVDFRSAEVADTVCRLHARVYISGVGSVCLSWFTGRRP